MFIDSLILYGLVKELKTALLSSQVKQIHQTDTRVLDMELYRPMSSPIHLIFCAQNPPCLYMDSAKKRSQYIDSQTFCMTLRKNLEGSRLSNIEQIQLDRILCFSFDRIETGGQIITKKLYAELIPSAPNLILTENGKILDVLIRSRKQHRDLSNQQTYVLPDGSSRYDFTSFSEEEIFDILRYQKRNAATFRDLLFSQFNGLSTLLIRQISNTAGILPDALARDLSEETLRQAARALYSIGRQVQESSGLYVYGTPGKETASLFPPESGESRLLPSVSQWIRDSMHQDGNLIAASIQELKKQVQGLLKKEERKERKILAELEETSLIEKYKLWGNLLSIYAYMKRTGQKEITVDDPFHGGNQETIPLQPELTLIQNSQQYFKKYNRMKTRLEIGQQKLEECRLKQEYLQNASFFADEIRTRQELQALRIELKDSGIDRYARQDRKAKKPEKQEEQLLSFSMLDHTIWIGRNSRQNEMLTLHKAGRNDLWLHAQKIPGSHVIIESSGAPVPEQVLEAAAAAAAWYSKGKNSGKVSVDYTQIRNVKKIKNAPPGMVNYTHQKTIVVAPRNPLAERK